MKTLQAELLPYLALLVRKWILLLILVLDVILLFVDLVDPTWNPPRVIFWAIAIAGLFWAGFEVNRDTLQQIPVDSRSSDPKLTIEPIEGSAYTFVMATEAEADPIRLARISLHVRVKNIGEESVDILNASRDAFRESADPWVFSYFDFPKNRFPAEESVEFPRRLVADRPINHTRVG